MSKQEGVDTLKNHSLFLKMSLNYREPALSPKLFTQMGKWDNHVMSDRKFYCPFRDCKSWKFYFCSSLDLFS